MSVHFHKVVDATVKNMCSVRVSTSSMTQFCSTLPLLTSVFKNAKEVSKD